VILRKFVADAAAAEFGYPRENAMLRPKIISHIERIAIEQEQTLAPLTDDLVLADSGLDSLSFAILVARLEDEFDLDPFAASAEAHYPVTLGDFVKFYEDAIAGQS
jgi:acyl carrier protein